MPTGWGDKKKDPGVQVKGAGPHLRPHMRFLTRRGPFLKVTTDDVPDVDARAGSFAMVTVASNP